METRLGSGNLWGQIFQLERSVQIFLRRLPKSSLNHQVLDEMGKLTVFMEDLSFQLNVRAADQRVYTGRLCWQATRELDFWVLTLKEINPDHGREIFGLLDFTRAIRARLKVPR
jgi:hypothetical protein